MGTRLCLASVPGLSTSRDDLERGKEANRWGLEPA
jgi:hypothetical protein